MKLKTVADSHWNASPDRLWQFPATSASCSSTELQHWVQIFLVAFVPQWSPTHQVACNFPALGIPTSLLHRSVKDCCYCYSLLSHSCRLAVASWSCCCSCAWSLASSLLLASSFSNLPAAGSVHCFAEQRSVTTCSLTFLHQVWWGVDIGRLYYKTDGNTIILYK